MIAACNASRRDDTLRCYAKCRLVTNRTFIKISYAGPDQRGRLVGLLVGRRMARYDLIKIQTQCFALIWYHSGEWSRRASDIHRNQLQLS